MSHDVFISYSLKDKEIANAMCASLESEKITCWIAPRDIAPGLNWPEAIIDAIEASKLMVVVLSTPANESLDVQREVQQAISKGKIIVPFCIEDIKPTKALEYCLGITQRLDAFPPPPEPHFSRLIESVRRLLEGKAPAPEARPSRESQPPLVDPAGSGYEYRSKWEMFGLPLVHIAMNLPLVNGRRRHARGIVAIGDAPRGAIAIGTLPIGGVAMGALPIGLVAIGPLAIGVFAIGAMAFGLVASWGALSMAPFATGCITIGYYTCGVLWIGHPVQPANIFTSGGPDDPHFLTLHWYNTVMTGLCVLSYLLQRLSRLWVKSVLDAGTSRHL